MYGLEDISPSVSVETVLIGAGSGSRHCGRSWLTIRVREPPLWEVMADYQGRGAAPEHHVGDSGGTRQGQHHEPAGEQPGVIIILGQG